MTTATETFDDMISRVTQERGKDYGHPVDDFRRAQALKAVVAECQDPLIRNTLEMICTKIARLIQTPNHVDSLVDIAGYARCGCMILDRRAEDTASSYKKVRMEWPPGNLYSGVDGFVKEEGSKFRFFYADLEEISEHHVDAMGSWKYFEWLPRSAVAN